MAQLGRTRTHTDAVNAIAPVANNWLASGSADCSIRLWLANPDQHLVDPEPVAEAQDCHQMAINALAPLKDGRWLASASDDTTIKLWQLPKAPGDTLQVQVTKLTTRCVWRCPHHFFNLKRKLEWKTPIVSWRVVPIAPSAS